MATSSKLIAAERRFPVRIRIGLPPEVATRLSLLSSPPLPQLNGSGVSYARAPA
jgi:hypothetical protein